MKFFHYHFVLKERISPEMEADAVSKFVVLERFNLFNDKHFKNTNNVFLKTGLSQTREKRRGNVLPLN